MKNNASVGYAAILIIGDLLTLLAAFSLAYILRVKIDNRPLVDLITARDYFKAMFSVLPLWILVHGLIGLYSPRIYEKRFRELGWLLVGSMLGILVIIGYDFVSPGNLFPARLVPVYGLILSFSFLVIFRAIARILRRSLYKIGIGVSNVLIVGDTDKSIEIAQQIALTKITGQQVLGIVGPKTRQFKHFSSFSDALKRINLPIHSIIQTELYKNQDKNDEVLRFAQVHHASYRFVPGNNDLFVGNIEVELFAGSIPMIAVHQTALVGWGRIAKRLFDIVASSILLIIFSPVLLAVAIIVKISDPKGPVFMRGTQQKRLTRFNNVFNVYKFRSHYAKFDGKTYEEVFNMVGKPELVKQYKENGYKMDKDFRVTPFGHFIRKFSIDELPQLINVWKGDISLVGPRALIPAEMNTYEKKHTILSVKSGLTGLAQISGRDNISFNERRKLDMYYVQNWSFWQDIIILIKTIRVVLRGSKQQ
ncbi:sugar transferase [Candidatus Saccharibacteria bacterium]|nr:sugar transferase [Candidatus Saccharibacteria bacterium]